MSNFLSMLLCLLTPFALSAQSVAGTWTEQITTPDGEQVTSTFVMTDEGILTVDFTSDGQIDVMSTYTTDGSQIIVVDTMNESPCKGKKGVYNFKIDGDTITISLVEDGCDLRRREQPWSMTRKR